MTTQAILDRVKRRIDPADDIGPDLDAHLSGIIEDVTSQLLVKLGGLDAVPERLSYIVVGVSVKMYNRIGSEGTASHTVDGETMTWSSDPFAEYLDDITAYLNANKTRRSYVQFL